MDMCSCDVSQCLFLTPCMCIHHNYLSRDEQTLLWVSQFQNITYATQIYGRISIQHGHPLQFKTVTLWKLLLVLRLLLHIHVHLVSLGSHKLSLQYAHIIIWQCLTLVVLCLLMVPGTVMTDHVCENRKKKGLLV